MQCSALQKGSVRLCSSHISRTAEAESQENLRNGCEKNELCGIILVKDLCKIFSHMEAGRKEKEKSSNQAPLFLHPSYFQHKIEPVVKKTGEKKCTFVLLYTLNSSPHMGLSLPCLC